MTAPTLSRFSQKILIVGCGNMAGAMLRRWVDSGLKPAHVAVVDPAKPPLPDGVVHSSSLAAWRRTDSRADIILLGIKPQGLAEVAGELAPLTADAMLVSMLAGAALADLAALFPQAAGVVRIMPNLPSALGKGITAVAKTHPLDAKRAKALDALLAPLGRTARFDDDNGFDLMTAFAGSGPAFVYRMIDAYRAAGERLGLDADMAAGLSSALFDGSVAMLAQADGATPAAMAARVTSKGGTTQAGLDVLDAEGRLVALFTETLRAARDRGRELAELARTT
ncbi:MAG: hypothetical protein RLZZ58_1022 [Pseudomonadota bacterium]